MLERADLEEHPDERAAQLTFVVGGAGFSGVETAGEIEDFIRRVRRASTRRSAPRRSAHLVELKDRVLRRCPRDGGVRGAQARASAGSASTSGPPIREVREGGVVIGDGELIPSRTVIWTGGVKPSPIVGEAGIEVDRAGRAIVAATMETSRAACGPSATARASRTRTRRGPSTRRRPRTRCARRSAWRGTSSPRSTAGRRRSSRSSTGSSARWRASAATPAWAWSSASACGAGSPGSCGAATTGRGCRDRRQGRVALDWLVNAVFGSDPVQLKVDYPGDRGGMGPSGTRRPPPRSVDPGLTAAPLARLADRCPERNGAPTSAR